MMEGWFTVMAKRHCGRDYGSELLNCYHFYRKVYGMEAISAWRRAKEACDVLR